MQDMACLVTPNHRLHPDRRLTLNLKVFGGGTSLSTTPYCLDSHRCLGARMAPAVEQQRTVKGHGTRLATTQLSLSGFAGHCLFTTASDSLLDYSRSLKAVCLDRERLLGPRKTTNDRATPSKQDGVGRRPLTFTACWWWRAKHFLEGEASESDTGDPLTCRGEQEGVICEF